jgi:putative transposase
VWQQRLLAQEIRLKKNRKADPSMVMIDGQTVRGGRTIGAKRSIVIEILGLPIATRVDPAKPHDVKVGRKLLADEFSNNRLPRVAAIVADRGYTGLGRLAAKRNVWLDIKRPPKGAGFVPIAPLYRVENVFARLGRWRRLSRCYEGCETSAKAWLEVAAVAYMFALMRAEPT